MAKKYEKIRTIVQGSFGMVFKCKDVETGQIVVIKSLRFRDKSEGVPCSVIREISLIQELEHPNIVSLLGVQSNNSGVDLVFEFLDTTLLEFIHYRRNILDFSLIKKFLYQILCGVSYCHSQNILHRDMEPDSLLLNANGRTVKIAYFSLARAAGILPSTRANRGLLSTSPRVGILSYKAPEVLLGSTNYSAAVDVWAVGCIFAELIIGGPLFPGQCEPEILSRIFSFFGVPNEDNWPGVSSLPNYVSSTEFPPERRQYLAQLVGGIESNGLSLLQIMLTLNPTARITAHAALSHAYFQDIRLGR